MGLDITALSILAHAHSQAPLGDVLTIGRQNIHVQPKDLVEILRVPAADIGKLKTPVSPQFFADEIITSLLNAQTVSSLDNSDYQSSSIVHDLNIPVPRSLQNRFDTILDFGTTEHIFNASQAIVNYTLMLKTSGRIIHVTPADRSMGHGLWQVSPELYHCYYSNNSGFSNLELYLTGGGNNIFYKFPNNFDFKLLHSTFQFAYAVAIATRSKLIDPLSTMPQQGSYALLWEDKSSKGDVSLINMSEVPPNSVQVNLKIIKLLKKITKSYFKTIFPSLYRTLVDNWYVFRKRSLLADISALERVSLPLK